MARKEPGKERDHHNPCDEVSQENRARALDKYDCLEESGSAVQNDEPQDNRANTADVREPRAEE